MGDLPDREGFFWAKWTVADAGTDRCRTCGHAHSEFEEAGGMTPERWEVVEVFRNHIRDDANDRWRVLVPGVLHSQASGNFVWGGEVRRG